jgi:hypothetical protein
MVVSKAKKEKLAESILSISEQFGLTGMSGFAALAIAEKVLSNQEQVEIFFGEVVSGEAPLENIPPNGVILVDKLKDGECAVEIKTTAVWIDLHVSVDNSKPLCLWEKKATSILSDKATSQGLVLVSKAHLKGVMNSYEGVISVGAWAIPAVAHEAKMSLPETSLTALGNWKKHGAKTVIGKSSKTEEEEYTFIDDSW